MELLNTMAKRYACRNYKDSQISEEELEYVLKAAYLAPVAYGDYDEVNITVVQSEDLIQEINKESFKALSGLGENPSYGVKTLIIISGKRESRHPENIAYCNSSCIAENIMLAAADIGLASIYLYAIAMVNQNNEKLLKKLQISNEFKPIIAVGVGLPNETTPVKDIDFKRIRTNLIR